VAAGVDVFRLNFSHGTHEGHRESIQRIRAAAADARRQIAILQDLSGPKIRIGRLAGGRPFPLEAGDTLRIAAGEFEGGPGRVSTRYADLPRSVKAGDRLLLDDGKIEVQVESSDGREIVSRVVNGGLLGEHKGINAPGVALPAASPTPKDQEDLRFGIANGVDIVGLSFVQSADDLRRTRSILESAGSPDTRLIAKIERPEAVTNIEPILEACDGIMVARGDLGLELPLERVPRVQKELTRAARARGLPVIVATQVLESMVKEPRPTRAEVSDAANAVDDGVDAIMLSGETAVGEFPVRVVETLDAVIRDAEGIPPSLVLPVGAAVVDQPHSRALCEAAVTLAKEGAATAIIAITRHGKTARVLSAFRPGLPIHAAAPTEAVARRLQLHRGVVPMVLDLSERVDGIARTVVARLTSDGFVTRGDRVVLVSITASQAIARTNFVRLFEVP
jgi:pyruvate kinase